MRWRALITALILAIAAPVAASAAPRDPVAQVHKSDRARAPQTAPREATLAEREAQSKDLEKFEGGQTVVIVTSTGTLILILILLIILL
ncbi:MAG TPA: hypothetical protein VKE22_04650 [Haliangiales bacterium]|nr:hypothetical protein [Haliangiales bacterium]